MVRKKQTDFSPVCIMAVTALVMLYLSENVQSKKIALIFVFVIISAMSLLQNLLYLKKSRSALLSAVFFVFAGLCIGVISSYHIQISRFPVFTLAEPDKITAISGKALTDPVPAAGSLYKMQYEIERCRYSDGSEFSASGICTVYIPAPYITEALPGGISTKNGLREIYAAGLRHSFDGKMSLNNSKPGEQFYAVRPDSGWYIPEKAPPFLQD
ncbi:hypothetical protein K7I13_01690 [Brucepastera parasyntrophica]|uniref:hypothetical protein n=1 Tax=Brucepastera parasyntrophica TaxID=2880008 RepID=UPI00210ABA9F|nr:hypothetical protein [Brucepastera parasyntrophica]ULQ60066.1 hypothetical protein K7I13_01690 [Brucepastera parasyntrophica]